MTSTQAITPFTFEYLEKILGWTSSMERKLMKLSKLECNDQLTYRLFQETSQQACLQLEPTASCVCDISLY